MAHHIIAQEILHFDIFVDIFTSLNQSFFSHKIVSWNMHVLYFLDKTDFRSNYFFQMSKIFLHHVKTENINLDNHNSNNLDNAIYFSGTYHDFFHRSSKS